MLCCYVCYVAGVRGLSASQKKIPKEKYPADMYQKSKTFLALRAASEALGPQNWGDFRIDAVLGSQNEMTGGVHLL